MSKIKVIVEDYQGALYQGEFIVPKVTCKSQARQELNKIISEVVEEFETTNLTIKLFGYEIVYKKGKVLHPYVLFSVGENYQNLINYYNAILN